MSSFSAMATKLKLINTANDQILKLKDNVSHYNELECGSGVLGRFVGCELIGTLKRFKE